MVAVKSRRINRAGLRYIRDHVAAWRRVALHPSDLATRQIDRHIRAISIAILPERCVLLSKCEAKVFLVLDGL